MKKLLWMLLAALPMQAVANDDDPIAYKCYYCTPDEMEVVALAQGVGQHYVYDANKLTIVGYNVSLQNGVTMADPFTPESWVETQFLGMMGLYNPYSGEMVALLEDVALLAPDTEHSRNHRYLWGHHLSALNPRHTSGRELVNRFLKESPDLIFLDTSSSNGRLLKFEHDLGDVHTIVAALKFRPDLVDSIAIFHFNHALREWDYARSTTPSGDFEQPIQNSREDFAPHSGTAKFSFRSNQRLFADAFMERAAWAEVPVAGEVPPYGNTHFECARSADNVQCQVR